MSYDNISIDYRDRVTIQNMELLNYFNYLIGLENLDEMIKQRIIGIQSKVNYGKISLTHFRSLVSIADKLTTETGTETGNEPYLISAIEEGKKIIKRAEEIIQESMVNKGKGNIVYVDEF